MGSPTSLPRSYKMNKGINVVEAILNDILDSLIRDGLRRKVQIIPYFNFGKFQVRTSASRLSSYNLD
jgi:hypothetical protein